MTAISIKVQGASSPEIKHRPPLLEVLVRSLIILCTAVAIVLSSMAVCDGIWIQTAGGHSFGLWHFRNMEEPRVAEGTMVVEAALTATGDIVVGQNQQAFNVNEVEVNQKRPYPPDCTTQPGQSGVTGVKMGLGLCRFLVSSAVVAAIFGLELLVISQVSRGHDASRRWGLGSALVLVAAVMSALSVVVFVVLLRGSVSLKGFTLNFWCQFATVFLFFLNGMAARHIHSKSLHTPSSGNLGKC